MLLDIFAENGDYNADIILFQISVITCVHISHIICMKLFVRCDMYLHVVEPKTQTIAPIPHVLKVIDAKYDFLKHYYAGFAIENVVVSIVTS